MRAQAIDQAVGASVHFKCEHLQHTGSFKFRGASHAVSLLTDDCLGVATHSSGNHGAALACAARQRGLIAHVVMPDNAVSTKVDAVRAHGGQVHFCQPTQAAREAGLADLIAQGLEPVPPYDDDRIILGQGSCALELIDQVPDLSAVFVPVGGGGLIAGTALALMNAAGRPKVVGTEPLGADDTWRSLQAGARVQDHHPDTIADGLRALVGVRNLDVIEQQVSHIVRVSEEAIVHAMVLIWQHLKQVVEPSAAVALAGLLADRERWQGQTVCVVLSGGNLAVQPLLERAYPKQPQAEPPGSGPSP